MTMKRRTTPCDWLWEEGAGFWGWALPLWNWVMKVASRPELELELELWVLDSLLECVAGESGSEDTEPPPSKGPSVKNPPLR